jgi:hypothetical protein
VLDQRGDVFGALAQRRHGQCHHRHPVEQIESEHRRVDLGAQVAVRRRDEPNVDRDVVFAAHAADAAALERAEQGRLKLGRKLADLVEEHRSPVGPLESSDVLALGPGECSAFVTEQLAREQRRGDGAAVHGDEGLGGAGAGVVDRPRQQLFSGSRLTE